MGFKVPSGNVAPTMYLWRFENERRTLIGYNVRGPLRHLAVPPSGKAISMLETSMLYGAAYGALVLKHDLPPGGVRASTLLTKQVCAGSQPCLLSLNPT